MSVFKLNSIPADDLLSSLRVALSYDQCTGEFRWLTSPRKKSDLRGQIAGKIGTHGYRLIGFGGKLYSAHRLAWLYVHGEWPPGYIDHINHDRLDNRIDNLRCTNQSENTSNRSSPRRDCNGMMGVQYNWKKWTAKIRVNGKVIYLGRFDTMEEAGRAYDEAVRLHRGPHAKTNADLGLLES
jgi:hypothetical protein